MKQKFLLLLLVAFSTKLFSQCAPTDTVTMGAGYANDVFYSLKNKIIKIEPNNNWHLAFSVQGSQFPVHPETGVSIRVNSVKGNVLVKLPGANAANWRSIDTTGLSLLPERLDSFKTWDISAFTKEYNYTTAPFNFIWGAYNNTTHNVVGTSVFVLYNKTANFYKKVFINKLVADTVWNVIISNIDNTDSTNLIFNKSAYPNRLFVYYDIVGKQLINREPVKTDWDIVWTRYKDMVTQFSVTSPYPLTGILANKGVTIAKNLGKKCNEVYPGNVTAPYISETNNIGWDWKIAPMGPGPYTIVDTFVFFVKAKDNNTYKLSFNSFGGSANGSTVINGRNVTSVKDIRSSNTIIVYPNPANSLVNLNTKETILNVSLTNMSGCEQTLNIVNNTVNFSDIANGIYIIKIQTSEGLYTQKIVRE
jgi:hypothetical protein